MCNRSELPSKITKKGQTRDIPSFCNSGVPHKKRKKKETFENLLRSCFPIF
jgi:hypothetical protein